MRISRVKISLCCELCGVSLQDHAVITEVPCSTKRNRVRAIGFIVIDGVFQVNLIRVVEKEGGVLLVAMPSIIGSDRYKDVAHPITSSFRVMINTAVLDEYFRLKSQSLTGSNSHANVQR